MSQSAGKCTLDLWANGIVHRSLALLSDDEPIET